MASGEPVYSVLSNSLLSICSSLLNDIQDGRPQSAFAGSSDILPHVSRQHSGEGALEAHPYDCSVSLQEVSHATGDAIDSLQCHVYDAMAINLDPGVNSSVGSNSAQNHADPESRREISALQIPQVPQRVVRDIEISGPSVSHEQMLPRKTHEQEEADSRRRYTCEECGKHFNYQRFYREHCRIHTGERPHECKFCGKSFRQSNALYIHERVHTGDKHYKCELCGRSFGRKDTLNTHVRTHTGDKPYKCSFCDRKFNQRNSRILHEKVHKNDRKFTCENCGMKFRQKIGLQNHQKGSNKKRKCNDCGTVCNSLCAMKVHRQKDHVEKVFTCEVCGTAYSTQAKLEKHKPCSGSNPSWFVCKVCSKTFDSVQILGSHECATTSENPYTCDVCDEVFKSSDEWKTHRMGHSEKEMFECTQCDMIFKAKKNLTRHMSVHKDTSHDSRNPQDDDCDNNSEEESDIPAEGIGVVPDKVYEGNSRTESTAAMMSSQFDESTLQSGLISKALSTGTGASDIQVSNLCAVNTPYDNLARPSNIEVQSGVNTTIPLSVEASDKQIVTNPTQMFVCSDCGKAFGKRRSFTAHRRTHRTDRPYKCKYCGIGFKQNVTLTHHVRQHTGEKPYSCKVCSKSFTRSDTLRTHMLIHSGAKPYKCKFCDKMFNQRSSRFFHERAHNFDKRYCCEACGAKFTQKGGLIVHQRKATKPRRCIDCLAEFDTMCALHVHQDKTHCRESHACQQCNRTFSSKKRLDRHKPCDPSLPCYFVCKNCRKCFDRIEVLLDHGCPSELTNAPRSPKSRKAKFSCEDCGKEFMQKINYLSHCRVHSAERPFECKYCGKSYKQQSALINHERIHSGEKPFICSVCNLQEIIWSVRKFERPHAHPQR